jgi:hypothetical protein
MTVTTDNIRDLLNRPRGLNNATISEYITIRTEQVNKSARNDAFLADSSVNAVTEAQKESAIKFLVCADCLQVLIDTSPSYTDSSERKEQDIRFATQMRAFERRANEMLSLISEKGGTAVVVKNTKRRVVSND